MEKRMITTDVTEEDLPLEGNLRPQTLDEYIGQEKTKNTLKIYIEAAKQRHDALDHVLFYGPPGLGKTTLSGIIANEMGTHMKVTSGPAIEKPGEMAAILNNLQEGDILFVDEIHRLNRQVEEVLYPAMEDFAIDIMIGKGASARSIRLDLPKFTLVGATTRAGLLSAPLRDRFGVMHHLEFYNKEELQTIILRSADVLGVEIDTRGAAEIAKRSRGTPRLANRLLKRVRDFAQVKYDGKITYDVASFALDLLDLIKEYSGDKPMESTNDLQCSDFATGKVAMIHNGSWDEASIRAIAPDIDMGYVYMPRMDEKAVLAVESNLTFRVAKDSENLDTVLDFLNYMCTSDYGRSWVPSVIGDISPLTGADAPDTQLAAETAAAQDNSVTCPWWIFKGPEGVEEPFGTAFQNYVAGNADRDETKEVLTQLFVDAYDAM